MAKVNVEVGARLAPEFKGTLNSATAAVSGMAVEMAGPMRDIAQGAGVAHTGFSMMREAITTRLLGPLATLVISLGGVSAAMAILNRMSATTAASLGKFSTVEDLEAQFRPLLKSTAAVKGRLAELAKFAQTTPFELPEVAAASKTLEVLTRGALSTGDGLRMVGDIAAQSGRPFQELAMWVGRMYDGLQSGRPVGEAMMRLQEMGVISGQVRAKIEAMQKSGMAGNEVWAVARAEFAGLEGSMQTLSQTVTGLRSNLNDARDALYRAMGESFVEQEKEAIRGAAEVTEAFIPIARRMMETLAATGATKTPGQWVPVFDQHLKKLMVTVLSAKDVVIGLWNALVVLAAGFAAATVMGSVTSMISFVAWTRRAIAESRALVAAKVAENQQWVWSIRNIRLNTAALTENIQAAGRSRAMAIAQAAAMTVARTAVGYLTASLRTLALAFVNPVTLALMAATAVWQWSESLKTANERVNALRAGFLDLSSETEKQLQQITTLADKAAFLTAQYEALKKAKAALVTAETPEEAAQHQAIIGLIELRIEQAEALNNAELGAGADRAKLLEDLTKMEREYAESKMTAAEKLQAKEKELDAAMAVRAVRGFKVAEAAKAASAAAIAEIDAQIMAQRELAKAARTRGDAGGEARALARVDELQQSKGGLTAQEEAARTAAQEQKNKTRALEIEVEKQRAIVREEERKKLIKDAELETEAKLAALRSTGAQRTIDEIGLQQELLVKKIKIAEAEKDAAEAAELRNRYAENERKLLEADQDRNRRTDEERQSREEAREERRLERLPKAERAAALKQKENALNAEAAAMEAKTAAARKTGDEGTADDLEYEAQKKRRQADQYGFRAEDVLEQGGGAARPRVSSLAQIGGASGEMSGLGMDVGKSQLKVQQEIKQGQEKMILIVDQMKQTWQPRPEWDKPEQLDN